MTGRMMPKYISILVGLILPLIIGAIISCGAVNFSVQIVPAVSNQTPPTQAVNAGFTTLWADFNWASSQVCVYHGNGGTVPAGCVNANPISNWDECGITDPTKIFHNTIFLNFNPGTPCQYAIVTDPANGNQALRMQYTVQPGSPTFPGISMATVGSNSVGFTFTHPQGFFLEAVYRIDANNANTSGYQAAPDGVYETTEAAASPGGACDVDLEPAELFSGSAGGGSNFADGEGQGVQTCVSNNISLGKLS